MSGRPFVRPEPDRFLDYLRREQFATGRLLVHKGASVPTTREEKSDAFARLRALRMDYLRRNVPENERLCPPDLAFEAMKAMVCNGAPLPNLAGELTVMGMRIGVPCRACGNRKKNVHPTNCDTCGHPLAWG